jgi:hypothetical protein
LQSMQGASLRRTLLWLVPSVALLTQRDR